MNEGNNFAQIEGSILQIGGIFGRNSEAQALVNAMNTKISTVENDVSNQTVLNVLYVVEIDFGTQNSVYTVGSDTFQNEIISSAGGLNVFPIGTGFPQKSFAEVETANPDVIVISATYNNVNTLMTEIAANPQLSATNAYHNNAIYFTQNQADNIFSRAGPRVAEAVQVLAHLLHPGAFNMTALPMGFTLDNSNYQNYASPLLPIS